MNVLIVDDDRFIVGALAAKIDWESLSVEHVYQAFNIRQAQKIFEEQVIHILISDIRMPQGSGLDLLSWVRERDNDVEAIFLTNYAQFHYAQKALELQSLDFFLKPVAFDKLYPVLKKAVERIQTKRGSLLNQKTARQVTFHVAQYGRQVDGHVSRNRERFACLHDLLHIPHRLAPVMVYYEEHRYQPRGNEH
jgi:YesN/AraC family two-component response regulator